jgi:hypothetical protein
MVEPTRRHGHFDPRFRLVVAPDRPPKLTLVPAAPRSPDRNGDVPDPAPRRLVLAGPGGRDDARLTDWENEGGRYAVEPALAVLGSEELPAGRDWYEFLADRFPGRRRHDLEALMAYEAYRSSTESVQPN